MKSRRGLCGGFERIGGRKVDSSNRREKDKRVVGLVWVESSKGQRGYEKDMEKDAYR